MNHQNEKTALGADAPSDRRLRITVVGLGYVGTVAATCLADAGHVVFGVDLNEEVVNRLNDGRPHIYERGLDALLDAPRGVLRFFTANDFDDAGYDAGDIVMIAVGTPTDVYGVPDLSAVDKAVDWVVRASKRSERTPTLVMKSTVPPGTGVRIREMLLPHGINYVSNPEFLREGSAVDDWKHPDRIVLGMHPGDPSKDITSLMEVLNTGVDAEVFVTDLTSSEMVKYASNTMQATRISFMNEIANICDKVGADINDVSRGVSMDGRTGSQVFAGLGYGGSCFPKDVQALAHLAREVGVAPMLIDAVTLVNSSQRMVPVKLLRERGLLKRGTHVAVLGLSFKPDTNDIREAPAIDIIMMLKSQGVRVTVFDPQAMERFAEEKASLGAKLCSTVHGATFGAHAVILTTEWDEIVNSDWQAILDDMRPPYICFDGRNALDPDEMSIYGFEYVGVGQSPVVTFAGTTQAKE